MRKGEYNLILKLTDNSSDYDDLVYRIMALRELNKLEDALEMFDLYQDILDKDLTMTFPLKVGLLCQIGEFQEAQKEVDRVANLPYQCQQVEEMIQEMPDFIKNTMQMAKQKSSSINEDEIYDALLSSDPTENIYALDMIKTRHPEPYLNEIAQVMTKSTSAIARGLAISLLVKYKINKEFDFLNLKGEIVKLNPSTMEDIFYSKEFLEVVRELDQINDKPLKETCVQIFLMYTVACFGTGLPHDVNMTKCAMYVIGKKYFKQDLVLLDYAKENNLDPNELEEAIKQIEENIL